MVKTCCLFTVLDTANIAQERDHIHTQKYPYCKHQIKPSGTQTSQNSVDLNTISGKTNECVPLSRFQIYLVCCKNTKRTKTRLYGGCAFVGGAGLVSIFDGVGRGLDVQVFARNMWQGGASTNLPRKSQGESYKKIRTNSKIRYTRSVCAKINYILKPSKNPRLERCSVHEKVR